MLRILQKAITLRKRCALWYDSEAGDGAKPQESLQGHAYFIDILEKKLDVLQQSFGQAGQDTNKLSQSKENAMRSDRANIFASLPVDYAASDEEIYRNGEGEESVKRCVPPTYGKATDAYEPEIPEEEVVFTTSCMFEDMERLRSHIKKTWQQYKDHNLSLINAATSTNTAKQFARGVEENFQQSFPQYADWPEVVDVIFPILAERYRIDCDMTHFEQVERLDHLHWGPFMRIYEFSHFRGRGIRGPIINEFYDPSLDFFSLPVAERCRRDTILLRHFFFEFLLVVRWDLPTMDELSIGSAAIMEEAMIGKPKIKLCLVFALRIFLDINHILGKLRQV